MKYKIVHNISRVFKQIFLLAASVFFLTFYHLYSGAESLGEISEAENDPLEQNVKVSKLSEKKEILQKSTTGLVYNTFKVPTKEDADSKSLVPKILHFMWIGSHVPEKYQENIIVWRENNPTYQVGEHCRHQTAQRVDRNISLRFSSGQTTLGTFHCWRGRIS